MSTDPTHSPAWDVEVALSFGSPEYAAVTDAYYGFDSREWWQSLGDLLGGRPGWHCELTSDGLLWSFGAMGASLFSISAPDDPADYKSGAFEVFDYEADTTLRFTSIETAREWLEENEERHRDHPRALRDMAAAFDWDVLKSMGVEVRVTYDGASFIGTFPKLPLEATFADDLPTLLVRSREAIGAAFDAPDQVVPLIEVVARLDKTATGAIA